MLGKDEIVKRKAAAWEVMRNCTLCPRACGVDRTAGELGYCRVGAKSRCFREVVLDWEDSGISPLTHVYFAGCNLRCASCTVMEWNVQPDSASETDVARLCEKMLRKKRRHAGMLNVLGGEPAVSIYGALEVIEGMMEGMVVAWHTNMYYGPRIRELLDGVVDVYLVDFKCGNADCAQKMVDAADYVDVVAENIMAAAKDTSVIVRHKIVPGHVRCCTKPILERIGEIPGVKINLRYNPVPQVVAEVMEGYVSQEEIELAQEYARKFKISLIE
jgi:putative pyruvate formate lyase activating enzyme